MAETKIVSFIVRFFQEDAPAAKESPGGWRGTIRHVQSREEVRFTHFQEALEFITRYVDLKKSEKDEGKIAGNSGD